HHLQQPGEDPEAVHEAQRAGRVRPVGRAPGDQGERPVPEDDHEQADRAQPVDVGITATGHVAEGSYRTPSRGSQPLTPYQWPPVRRWSTIARSRVVVRGRSSRSSGTRTKTCRRISSSPWSCGTSTTWNRRWK